MDGKLPFSPLKQALGARLVAEAGNESSFRAEHRLIGTVCDRLEAIADALPEAPQRESLPELVALLRFGIPAHCRYEESRLRELLAEEAERGWLHEAADLIIAEHHENESLMLELAEALEDHADRCSPDRADALGYLLRHFFSQMRRHMAWEDQVISELQLRRR